MNKKFSTLAVAAMLASAFAVNAAPGDVVTQLAKGNNGKQYQLRAVLPGGTDGGYLTLDKHDGALKLEENPSVLGGSLWCVNVDVQDQGKNPIFDFTNKAYGSLLEVTVGGWDTSDWTPVPAGDSNPAYYVDKAQAHVGGEVRGWEFSPVLSGMFGKANNATNKDADDFAKVVGYNGKVYSLNSYISSTQVATLIWDDNKIKVAVVNASDVAKLNNRVKFFLQEAYSVDLTANQFNTILNTQEAKEPVKMTFYKDYNNTDVINLLSTNEFNAFDVTNDVDGCTETADLCDLNGEHNFVYLYKTEANGDKQYLRVDTAYANGYGTKFLKFAFGSFKNNVKPEDAENGEKIIPNQYKFRLNYCPTDDSLSIQVMSALYKLQDDGKPWRTLVKKEGDAGYTGGLKDGEKGYGESLKDYVITNWNDKPVGGMPNPSGMKIHYTNWVKLQDLESSTESRIITIGDAPINTHISFGYGDCAIVASAYTSVADGVYYIKNAKGQYLAHPIYNNGTEKPFFVTVNADEQEVAHMPAYQWVVLKKYTNTPASRATSPVMIANREFDTDFEYVGVQLMKKEGAKFMSVNGSMMSTSKWGWDTNEDGENDYYPEILSGKDSIEFVAVPAASVKDQYLGYKKINKDSLLVNKYTFNYWHPYADDKFIAKSDKDSTLTVLDGKDAFGISEIDDLIGVNKDLVATGEHFSTIDMKYGYGKNLSDDAFKAIQKRIPNLARLVRTVYEVNLNKTDWKVNDNDKFNLGANYDPEKSPWTGYVQDEEHYYAFFKENNHINGKDYYAIVRAIGKNYDEESGITYIADSPAYEYQIAYNKAGVSDYDGAATLKNQVLAETRTSSFAIERDETPLYRRFNSTLEGQAGDAVDTLRFYEKYRGEYLMIEANPSFTVNHIDFLGIDAKDKAKGGLAFIVDTAWVNRGAGNIKPQYLISIDRHDYQGVAGEPCTEAGPHIDESGHITEDPMECVHAHKAVPGFKRGKFLINFHDFASGKDMVNSDKYKWAEYDRAGFKEAIIVKDTMYILRDEFKNLKNEEINLAKIASAEVEAQRAYSKKHGNLDGFVTYRSM